MPHTTFPFDRAPNAFLMALPDGADSLQVKAFETPWGTTDEQLCFWNGVLFGQQVQDGAGNFAKPLPLLDRQREYPWPSADAFRSIILDIIGQFPGLEVWCERDCDQHPVKIISSRQELLSYLELVFSFCEGGLGECPSFSYRP